MNKLHLQITLLIALSLVLTGCTFAGDHSALTQDTPGFLMGIWHGVVAPYTLIVRFFLDIQMYAIPNTGLGYDVGFLLGIIGAIPLGWLATLISIAFFLLA
ncbi:hypothetical protein JXD20_00455 [Candidatus Peregrinibacteria bacterium]|nr:hypothetical protein [Candidatus Peregrinibacteria bacterium]